MNNITPKKCTIVASGVKSHREFVDLVKERLGELLPVPEHEYKRAKSEYIGGEHRQWTESPTTNIMLAFESKPWHHEDVAAAYVANALIGCSSVFSDSFPGRGMYNRAISNIVQKHPFVARAFGLNSHFSDSGLWGLAIEGAGSHSQELIGIALEEIGKLKTGKISDEELNRAKNVLKAEILTHPATTENRL